MDYSYKKSGAIFNAHSYWTKQPVEVIQDFIKRYSKEGDIVLDPFCGTGMTGVAAIMSNRKYLLSDLSPTCIHISKGYCTKLKSVNEKKLLDTALSGVEKYFETKCPHCGELQQIDYAVLNDKLEELGETEIERLVFHCKKCKKKISKQPDSEDLIKHKSEDYKDYYYPDAKFFGQEPQRNYKKGIRKVFQLYSGRNLSALCRLLSNIRSIKDDNARAICLFAFTSIVFNCSLMSRYNPKYENTQIRMGTFYIPWKIKDNNVALSYKRKLSAVLKSNAEIFKNNSIYDGKIILASATDLKGVDDESVDYIYTDPPYSDKISYSELNIVYESWLGESYTDVSKEMIVSKSHDKSIVDYCDMFRQFLREAYRVLKDGANITIIFHNSSLQHWKYFQQVVVDSGFTPVKSDTPDRLISNAKTSTQYQSTNISRCFLAFTMRKAGKETISLTRLKKRQYEDMIHSLRVKANEAGYTTPADQYDYIINSLIYTFEIRDDVSLF